MSIGVMPRRRAISHGQAIHRVEQGRVQRIRLEIAQQIAAHESSRPTGLYDRRGDAVSLDEVELIRIKASSAGYLKAK
jgi:hypothetical protein